MIAVILAGGLGSRLSEETLVKPKPMVEIGEKPILWHIMKIYSLHGIKEFIICCGYKGHIIKEYFKNYFYHMSDVTFNLSDNTFDVHSSVAEDWKVTVMDTGQFTQTGGRLKRIRKFLGDKDFCFTYGDGVGDINITSTIKFHRSHKKLATVTATRPPGRFGALTVSDNIINSFSEKPKGEGSWVNAGFFVLSPKVIDYISDDSTVWEKEPMENLAADGEFMAYFHKGFWQPMDTLRDKMLLDDLCKDGNPVWLQNNIEL